MLEILEKNVLKSFNYGTSINVTYPRTVNIIFDNYPYLDVINNLMISIKNNLSSDMKNYTNVKGGMTKWDYFINNPLFDKFITYVITKYQSTHPKLFENFFDNNKIIEAWGNEIKKGDSLKYHNHTCHHGVLYLTKGCDLILPELNLKIKPEIGDYYIFPPHVLHGFPEAIEKQKRYSLIFNIEPKVY